MKKRILWLIASCLLLVGCKDNTASLGMGECVYRSGFLWTDDIGADTTYVEQSFSLDYSGFQENGQIPQAQLCLCDGDANELDLKSIEVWANGQKLTTPIIDLSGTVSQLDFKFRCIPSSSMDEGRKDILLKLADGTNLDKTESSAFGDATITPGQDTVIGRMHFSYVQKWNPWNLYLFWFLIILAALLFAIWLMILAHRLTLPRISPNDINALQFLTQPLESNMVISPSTYFLDQALKNQPLQCIRLVSSDTPDRTHCEKWGVGNLLNMGLAWNGNIFTIEVAKNDFFEKITLVPTRNSSVAIQDGVVASGSTYFNVLVNDEKRNTGVVRPLKKDPDYTLLAEHASTKVWLAVFGYFHNKMIQHNSNT